LLPNWLPPPQLADSSDHSYFGRPEHDTKARQVYTVTAATGGADVASEYAAAFAAAAVLFKSSDAAYAVTLFKRAQQAFAFAEAYKSK
jgi:endoglucanase